MIILSTATGFERIFPNFQGQVAQLHSLLLPVAVVLLIAGMIAALRYATTPRSILRVLATTILVSMAIAFWGDWTSILQSSFAKVIEAMDANPEQAADRYLEVLAEQEEDRPLSSSGFFGLPNTTTLYDVFLFAGLKALGIIASVLIWLAYLLQQFFVGLSYAFAPIFLGMLMLRSTSLIGMRFILGTIGILAWPVGWAVASIGTSNFIDVAAELRFFSFGDIFNQRSSLMAGVIGLWIIITTVIAPVIIQGVLSAGANAGSAILGGTVGAASSAARTALSTGQGVAASGATGGAALLGGGLVLASAGGSLAGSAMRGGGHAPSGSSFSAFVPLLRPQHGSTKESPSNNDDSPPPNKPSPSNDLTRDQEVENLLNHSHNTTSRT